MRKFMIFLLGCSLLFIACGEDKKPEIKYNPDRVENEKHKPPEPDESVPQAGINAMNKMKKISKDEKEKVQEDQKVEDQADTQ